MQEQHQTRPGSASIPLMHLLNAKEKLTADNAKRIHEFGAAAPKGYSAESVISFASQINRMQDFRGAWQSICIVPKMIDSEIIALNKLNAESVATLENAGFHPNLAIDTQHGMTMLFVIDRNQEYSQHAITRMVVNKISLLTQQKLDEGKIAMPAKTDVVTDMTIEKCAKMQELISEWVFRSIMTGRSGLS